jgi:hypothetical protein
MSDKKTTKPSAKPSVKMNDLPAKKEIKGGRIIKQVWVAIRLRHQPTKSKRLRPRFWVKAQQQQPTQVASTMSNAKAKKSVEIRDLSAKKDVQGGRKKAQKSQGRSGAGKIKNERQ